MKKHLVLSVIILFLSSCLSTDEAPEPRKVEINIDCKHDMNGGKVTYALVRHVSRQVFALETYDNPSLKVFNSTDDKDHITQQILLPGKKSEFKIDSQNKDIAIYFFFTNPNEMWKVYLPEDKKNDAWYLEVKNKQVSHKTQTVISAEKEHWFWRIF